MCNKRRTSHKNNRSGKVGHFFILIMLSGIALGGWGCSVDQSPLHTDEIIKTEYPRLVDSITQREAGSLIEFINHENEHVRSLAWRALAKSDISDLDDIFDKVVEANEPGAWFSLSYMPLQGDQLAEIVVLFTGDPSTYSGSCEVFRRQGKAGHAITLLNLLNQLERKTGCAAAIGTILAREEIPESDVQQIIHAAFDSEYSSVQIHLLYGLYRSPLNRPGQESELYCELEENWIDAGIGRDGALDQYMMRILGEQGANRFLEEKGSLRGIGNIQLLIEFARTFDAGSLINDGRRDAINGLLAHRNPHVVVQTLERLKELQFFDEELADFIHRNISSPTRNHEMFITSLEYLQQKGIDVTNQSSKIEFAQQRNHYLTDRILGIYRNMEPHEDFMHRLQVMIEKGGVRGMHAIRVLTEVWVDGDESADEETIREMVRHAVETGDRSVISGLQTLLTDENLISDDDFGWINSAYARAAGQNSEDNIEAFEQILETRFPDRFEKLSEEKEPEFRIPDWGRLYELGTRPIWRLDTEKGIIEVRLDPLSAPFTVSSIDSLSRAGAYNDVAFHRVVRNFVVQGGDVGRRDGFGGPGYTIPTEPSLRSFRRGKAGIASSGTDTEGSQYFFMHQWAPHLDGDYTLFGEVIRGMEVVDRLQIGDRVRSSSISVR